MKSQKELPSSVPPDFHKFFWDVDAKKLDPRDHPKYIINRLLDKGNLDAARWVLHNFPKELIIETIKKMRDFSPKTANFWAQFYSIPKEEIACLNPQFLALRKQLWPY